MLALIGAGYWGKNHLRVLKELKVLRMVCDSDESIREKYPDVAFTSNLAEVLNNPEIQGVVISTPAVTHYEIAKKALLAGKHVLVEKPLALKIEEAEELVSLAQDKVLMTGHILLYHPAIIKIKQLIDSGELGEIRYIWSNRLNFGKIRNEENVLWSFAPHDISVILHILGEPEKVTAMGRAFLREDVADTTLSVLEYPNNVSAHIFVSWLNPFKEQKLSIIGSEKMAVFDGMRNELVLYPHQLNHHNIKGYEAIKKEGEVVSFEQKEPLTEEIKHFLECIKENKAPKTDGLEGLRVLKILNACQDSLGIKEKGEFQIGKGTKVWQNCQVLKGARIGEGCVIGHNCFVGSGAVLGKGVKLESNVDVWDLVTLEDYVFVGPSAVFTNDLNPRAKYPKKHYPQYGKWLPTLVKQGASIGANAVIVCNNTIGKWAMVGAGSVVTKDVPDYAIVVGSPARVIGYACECGNKLEFLNNESTCSVCERRYKKEGEKVCSI